MCRNLEEFDGLDVRQAYKGRCVTGIGNFQALRIILDDELEKQMFGEGLAKNRLR